MIAPSTFTKYLAEPPKLQALSFRHIGQNGKYIDEWINNLSAYDVLEQCVQIKTTLGELVVAQIKDSQRLKLMTNLFIVIERVAAQLRNTYQYEIGPLNPDQLQTSEQVRSLYYLSALVFNGAVERLQESTEPVETNRKASWRQLLARPKVPSNHLAIAIYGEILSYQKLLLEFAFAYQKPIAIVWRQLNQLYLLAVKGDIANVDLSRHSLSKQASSIHKLYCQVCLAALLNLATYRRQDIIAINRILPKWSSYISASLLPQSKTRFFVNLGSDAGPEYLNPTTAINPYDDQYQCLFIELIPLMDYLKQQSQIVPNDQREVLLELRLSEKALLSLQHQYFSSQRRTEPRSKISHATTLFTGFHQIHYHIAGGRSLGDLIHQKELPTNCQPKGYVQTDRASSEIIVEVSLLDQSASGYRFRTKQVSSVDMDHQARGKETADILQLRDGSEANWLFSDSDFSKKALDLNREAVPILQVMSLFAIQSQTPSETQSSDGAPSPIRWELGIVRWIDTSQGQLEAGGKVLGVNVTACGIRLESNDGRRQNFVAGLLLAGDPDLNTKPSLIMARYSFKEGDQVVLRIGSHQNRLVLQKNILRTDDIDQYEIARAAHPSV